MQLIPKFHTAPAGRVQICEIRTDDGKMVGTIYPTPEGIKIISPNFVKSPDAPDSVEAYLLVDERVPIPQFDIPFGQPGPYSFVGGKLMKYGLG